MFTNINRRCGILYKHHVHKTLQYPLPVYFTVSQGSTSCFIGGFFFSLVQSGKSISPKSMFYLALYISGNQTIHVVIFNLNRLALKIAYTSLNATQLNSCFRDK